MNDLAVIGTGLIGTSIALGAQHRLGLRVRGFDADEEALAAAAARGALEPATSLEKAVRGADLVIVCTPVSAIPRAAGAALHASDAVVTDAGSVKAGVMRAVREVAGAETVRFVGGHPLTGSERSGPAAAAVGLLDGATWALTPGEETDPGAVRLVEDVVRRLGATPVRLEPERHDAIVAVVSHLPQVASTALMRAAASRASGEPGLLMLAAGGFRDLTRLAASTPELWVDILLANRELLGPALDSYVEELRHLAKLVEDGDAGALRAAFREAKGERLALAAKPQARTGLVILAVPIPDRPGALAEITTILAEREVNIEDIEMVHSAEGARGAVHFTVGAADAETATQALREHGHEAARLT